MTRPESEPFHSRVDGSVLLEMATPFTPPIALNGVIDKPGDIDHFVFKATKGQTFDIRVFARALRSPLDAVLYVGARNAGASAGNDDSAGPDSYLRFSAPNDGEYVIWLIDQLSKGKFDEGLKGLEAFKVAHPKHRIEDVDKAIEGAKAMIAEKNGAPAVKP